jgi:hypothetical protein
MALNDSTFVSSFKQNKMKHVAIVFLTLQTLFNMETQAQAFKTIEAEKLTLDVFNASENSFGVASVIISGKKDAVLIDAQFTLAHA